MTKKSTTVSKAPALKQLYDDKIRAQLKDDLSLANINQVPKLDKLVVSVGLGKSKDDKKAFEVARNTLRKITGQEPVLTYAKKSIAAFKTRDGNKLGMKVTLRGNRAYEMLNRLIDITIPRLRDFHGVSSKSFDNQGNFNLGFKDQTVFPEIDFDDMSFLHGLQVTISIANGSVENSKKLLESFGMPFEKSKEGK